MLAAPTAYYRQAEPFSPLSGQPEAEEAVRGLFAVKEVYVLPEGELEFQVAYGEKTKADFVRLKARLAPLGFRPELAGSAQECALTLRKVVAAPKKLPRIPVLFALFTITALVVSALLQQQVYHALAPSWPYYVTFSAFGVAVAVLLGAHEIGQRLMARARDAGHASSYLIPGIPVIPPFLPALVFDTTLREPALTRFAIFYTVVAGANSMLAVAVLFFAVGTVTAVQSAVPFASTNLGNTTVTINPNAIELALGGLLGPFAHPIAAGYAPVSPIEDGSIVGFILVFLSLLPIASYDGGFLATLAWGPRAVRAAGYLSVLVLLVMDTWTYWAIAVIALLMVGRPYQLKLLDDVSPLSTSRKWLLLGAILVAFLCLPIPSNIATLPLG